VELAGGVKAKIICGAVDGVKGPVHDIVTRPEYLDVSVPAGATFTHPVERGHTAFAYVIDGAGYFDDDVDAFPHEVVGKNYFALDRQCLCGNGDLILYGDGEAVFISAKERSVRFLLVSGKPIGEPVAWYGTIVMNTREELKVAFDEFQRGTFIKHKNPVRE
jgi:redox-sensitive bicupin YhaK (pirin superfamily)